MFLKYLIAACTFLGLAGAALITAAPPGFIEGHVKIFPLSEVNLPDDANAESAQPYSEYPLIIRTRDGQEIARVTADGNGNYRAALPPGDYILDVQGRAPKRVRVNSQPFTIVSNKTVHVDMDIDTGIR